MDLKFHLVLSPSFPLAIQTICGRQTRGARVKRASRVPSQIFSRDVALLVPILDIFCCWFADESEETKVVVLTVSKVKPLLIFYSTFYIYSSTSVTQIATLRVSTRRKKKKFLEGISSFTLSTSIRSLIPNSKGIPTEITNKRFYENARNAYNQFLYVVCWHFLAYMCRQWMENNKIPSAVSLSHSPTK